MEELEQAIADLEDRLNNYSGGKFAKIIEELELIEKRKQLDLLTRLKRQEKREASEIARLRGVNSELGNHARRLETKVKELQTDAQLKNDRYNEYATKIEKQVDIMEARIRSLESENQLLRQRNSELEEEIKQLNTRDVLETDESLYQRISELEEEIKVLKAPKMPKKSLETLRAELAKTNADLKTVEAAIVSKSNKLEALEERRIKVARVDPKLYGDKEKEENLRIQREQSKLRLELTEKQAEATTLRAKQTRQENAIARWENPEAIPEKRKRKTPRKSREDIQQELQDLQTEYEQLFQASLKDPTNKTLKKQLSTNSAKQTKLRNKLERLESCVSCGKPNVVQECGPCGARYCDDTCQRRHWSEHSKACGRETEK